MQNSVAWTVISDVYTKGCGRLEWIMSAGSTNKPVCVCPVPLYILVIFILLLIMVRVMLADDKVLTLSAHARGLL